VSADLNPSPESVSGSGSDSGSESLVLVRVEDKVQVKLKAKVKVKFRFKFKVNVKVKVSVWILIRARGLDASPGQIETLTETWSRIHAPTGWTWRCVCKSRAGLAGVHGWLAGRLFCCG